MGGEVLKTRGVPPGYLIFENRLKLLEKSLHRPHEGERTNERQRLKEAAAEFESLFIYYILRRMRATIPKSGFLGNSPQQKMYTSLLDQELSKQLAAGGGIGLSRMLIEQLAKENVSKP